MEINQIDLPEIERRILYNVYTHGSATRQSLVDDMGCTLLTVSKAVLHLLGEKLLVVDGSVPSSSGRRKDILKINPDGWRCLCADIGYGSIKIGMVRMNGVMEKKVIIPCTKDPIDCGIPFEETLSAMENMLEETGRDNVFAIGVGISGLVNSEEGRVLFCPNLRNLDDRLLAQELSEYFKKPVLIDTSARCMAAGEFLFGAGRGISEQIFFSLGTGSIAAGIISDNRIFRGGLGFAGEVGHTSIRRENVYRRCTCGNYNCLEDFASMKVLAIKIQSKLGEFRGYSTAKHILKGQPLEVSRLREVWLTNDPIVVECFEEAIKDIASVLVGVLNLLMPTQAIIGGSFPEEFPEIVQDLERRILPACLYPLQTRLKVTASELGEDAGLRGAAGMIMLKHLGQKF